ncbi:MAG TPA: ATP-binding protein [Thermoanaerobaculia bacterium]|jgi:serine/threonine-protein kinase RsbT|nr:ATP-binding protein [Thermoanaerobaculia bacterium]
MKTVESEIGAILTGTISVITQRSIFNRMGSLAALQIGQLTAQDRLTIMRELENSVRLFARNNSAELIAACSRALADSGLPAALTAAAGRGGNGASAAGSGVGAVKPMSKAFDIEQEKDIASARLEAWSEAVRIGLSKFASVKVATAVSELARNIVFYAGKGKVELRTVKDDKGASLHIVASDQGPGITPAKLDEIWGGTYKSQRGMGKGLVAVKKLVDEFHLDTAPGRGTTVTCVFRGER